ncbi:hypothetical protein [Aliiroseovarius sp. YM-037]|uniref:hypothetical protein n=1 Tax=Aliiroseovarius sp. YM-037 TaxID=3341728 RepID=UPI003A809684
MNYVKIYAGEDGKSRFVDETWQVIAGDFTPPSPSGYMVTPTMSASGVLVMHHPADYLDDWHCAPALVLGTVLKGSVRILTSNGDARVLAPGDQFLAADLTGSGHKMEEANGESYDLALVVLDNVPASLPRGL